MFQYSSKAQAIQALENARQPVIESAEIVSEPIQEKIEPIAIVPIEKIKELVKDPQSDKLFQSYLNTMKYNALYALYEKLQDDDDVELLLLAI